VCCKALRFPLTEHDTAAHSTGEGVATGCSVDKGKRTTAWKGKRSIAPFPNHAASSKHTIHADKS
jgi:hypothetical protein